MKNQFTMSGLIFLNKSDFQLKQGDKGLNLSLICQLNGMCLVLFYTNECPYCEQVIKMFKQLLNNIKKKKKN